MARVFGDGEVLLEANEALALATLWRVAMAAHADAISPTDAARISGPPVLAVGLALQECRSRAGVGREYSGLAERLEEDRLPIADVSSIADDDRCDVATAAKLLGVKRRQALNLVRRHGLGVQVGEGCTWVVSRTRVLAFRDRRREVA